VDNDLANVYSMLNADFVYTLEFQMDRGGEVGLHGYTHQYGNEVSIDGTEFAEGRNDTEEKARLKFESALAAARKLRIPVTFWEFPHYAGTERQFGLAEEYFDIIYNHPYKKWPSRVTHTTSGGRDVAYIHTTLDELDSAAAADEFIAKIKALGGGALASMYYHTYIEHLYISVQPAEGGVGYDCTYDPASPLHRIVEAMQATGRSFVTLAEIAGHGAE